MNRLLICLLLFTMVQQCSAQSVYYGFKIKYNEGGTKDSSAVLQERKYYDGNMRLIREVVLGPGDKDSCWETNSYDSHNNIVKITGQCAEEKTIYGTEYFVYVYGKNGEVIKVTSKQSLPYFQYSTILYSKDSVVTKYYLKRRNAKRKIFDSKDIEIYRKDGRKTADISLTKTGDTIWNRRYLYFPLADTSKNLENKIDTTNLESITYYNSFLQDEIIDFYGKGICKERIVKKYSGLNKIIREQYFNCVRKDLGRDINYVYDSSGNLLHKKDENLRNGNARLWQYKKGLIIREDYVYENILDHSFIYSENKNLFKTVSFSELYRRREENKTDKY